MSERERFDGQCVFDLPERVVCVPSEGEPLRLVSDNDPWAGDRTPRTNARAEYIRADIAAELVEKAAVAAWNHFMSACQKRGVNPSELDDLCAADAVRAILAKHEAERT